MRKNILSLMLLVVLTSSCMVYHVNSIDTSDDFYPPKPVEKVVYFQDIGRTDSCPQIGTVTINAERKQRNIDDVIAKMKREAAVLGGDTIADIRTDATGVWKRLPAQETLGNAYVRANYMVSVFLCEGADTRPVIRANRIMIKASGSESAEGIDVTEEMDERPIEEIDKTPIEEIGEDD